MPRPLSWLPRLPAIARAVAASVRSHWTARDLERLFEIQPRSAQMLMGLLPTVRIGRSLLVEREALAQLLARLEEAEEPAAELRRLRARGKPPAVRRQLRDLVRQDVAAGRSGLPPNVALAPGRLTVRFGNMEELASALLELAALLDEDLEGFAQRYEPATLVNSEPSDEDARERADAEYIRRWIEGQNSLPSSYRGP